MRYLRPMSTITPKEDEEVYDSYARDFGSGSVISDYEYFRRIEVKRQKGEGRSGGGPKCPRCFERCLVAMSGSNPGLRQCGGCGSAFVMRVESGTLRFYPISPKQCGGGDG